MIPTLLSPLPFSLFLSLSLLSSLMKSVANGSTAFRCSLLFPFPSPPLSSRFHIRSRFRKDTETTPQDLPRTSYPLPSLSLSLTLALVASLLLTPSPSSPPPHFIYILVREDTGDPTGRTIYMTRHQETTRIQQGILQHLLRISGRWWWVKSALQKSRHPKKETRKPKMEVRNLEKVRNLKNQVRRISCTLGM